MNVRPTTFTFPYSHCQALRVAQSACSVKSNAAVLQCCRCAVAASAGVTVHTAARRMPRSSPAHPQAATAAGRSTAPPPRPACSTAGLQHWTTLQLTACPPPTPGGWGGAGQQCVVRQKIPALSRSRVSRPAVAAHHRAGKPPALLGAHINHYMYSDAVLVITSWSTPDDLGRLGIKSLNKVFNLPLRQQVEHLLARSKGAVGSQEDVDVG